MTVREAEKVVFITLRLAQWDYRIDNNGTLEDLERNVEEFVRWM